MRQHTILVRAPPRQLEEIKELESDIHQSNYQPRQHFSNFKSSNNTSTMKNNRNRPTTLEKRSTHLGTPNSNFFYKVGGGPHKEVNLPYNFRPCMTYIEVKSTPLKEVQNIQPMRSSIKRSSVNKGHLRMGTLNQRQIDEVVPPPSSLDRKDSFHSDEESSSDNISREVE